MWKLLKLWNKLELSINCIFINWNIILTLSNVEYQINTNSIKHYLLHYHSTQTNR